MPPLKGEAGRFTPVIADVRSMIRNDGGDGRRLGSGFRVRLRRPGMTEKAHVRRNGMDPRVQPEDDAGKVSVGASFCGFATRV